MISLEKRRRPREYGMKGLVDQARIDTGVCREGDLMGVSEREIQLFQYLARRLSYSLEHPASIHHDILFQSDRPKTIASPLEERLPVIS